MNPTSKIEITITRTSKMMLLILNIVIKSCITQFTYKRYFSLFYSDWKTNVKKKSSFFSVIIYIRRSQSLNEKESIIFLYTRFLPYLHLFYFLPLPILWPLFSPQCQITGSDVRSLWPVVYAHDVRMENEATSAMSSNIKRFQEGCRS